MTASTQPDRSALLGQLAEGALDGDWTLAPARSTVNLKTASMWGLMKINATFGDLSGTASVVAGSVAQARLVVGSSSIDTKNKKRDTHLKSADFLDVEKYPQIVFELNSIAPSAGTVSAHGRLTVGDVTKPITVEVTPSAGEDGSIVLNAALEIDRSDYGLTWNQMGMASSKNALTIVAAFTRG